MKYLTAEVIYGFVKGVLLSRYDNPKPIPALHMDLWRLCCSDHKNVAAAAPRGHAKSTSVTHAFSLAAALFREKQHILIVSDTEGQAKEFLKDIKTELLENDKLIDLFKVNGFIKETESEIIVDIGDDHHMFRILAKGSGQKVRGIKWRNMRPDLIVGDDLENDDIVLNQERRDKFRRWLFNALVPCLSRNGCIRIVGTILHFDSALERLMPKADPAKNIKLITTPLAEYTDQAKPTWKSVRFRAHDEDFEHILWPEQFSKEDLIGIREQYIQQGFPEGYAQEYLNYPLDESTAYFRKPDMLAMDDGDWKKSMIYYVGVDFAISQRSRADYTVLSVIGQDPEGQSYVIDVRRSRWDTLEIVDEIFNVYMRYRPECFFFEGGSIWLSVETILLQQMPKRGIFFDYVVVPPAGSGDKMVRARPLQFRLRAGAVRFDKDAPWYADLEDEVLRFPKGGHDDQVDSLAIIFLKLQELADAPTWAERKEEAYEEEVAYYDEFWEDANSGMSPITGY